MSAVTYVSSWKPSREAISKLYPRLVYIEVHTVMENPGEKKIVLESHGKLGKNRLSWNPVVREKKSWKSNGNQDRAMVKS